MPDLAHYMAQYDHEHSSAWNKLCHGVGIPMIFAGAILVILTKWLLGLGVFLEAGPCYLWDTGLKAIDRHFFRDLFICWLVPSG